MSDVLSLARPDILALKPYEHAEWEASLERLHANELPWRPPGDATLQGLNRYPEPQPRKLVSRLAGLYGVPAEKLLVGRGSDEAIDLLVRAFCRAGIDAVLTCPPTFGMYAVAARIQGAAVRAVPLRAADFGLDAAAVLDALRPEVKIIFLCSPNNPTGNRLAVAELQQVIEGAAGRALVVVDEAYIEFSGAPSLANAVTRWPHLVVLRTLSKAYGLAGARCGALIAAAEIIALLRKIIPPYAVSQLTSEACLELLQPAQLAVMRARLALLASERQRLATTLAGRPGVRVWPSDANFLLLEFPDPERIIAAARAVGLQIRDVRGNPALRSAVRVTVGAPSQNDRLLEVLS